uniref:Uncharacterized protein n=1 Tax=Aegilops tauschii subsp. strangulata TaxID=200361 RepID=A0A453C7R3_AEGTS
ALRLQPFFPGALVYLGAGDGGSPFHMLSDPFRFPIRSLSSVFSPVGIARVAVFSSGAAPSLTPSRAAASLPTASSAASISLLVADLARAESWLETALKDSAHGRSPETWGKAGSRVVLAPPRMVPAAVAAREDTALTARTTRAAAAICCPPPPRGGSTNGMEGSAGRAGARTPRLSRSVRAARARLRDDGLGGDEETRWSARRESRRRRRRRSTRAAMALQASRSATPASRCAATATASFFPSPGPAASSGTASASVAMRRSARRASGSFGEVGCQVGVVPANQQRRQAEGVEKEILFAK